MVLNLKVSEVVYMNTLIILIQTFLYLLSLVIDKTFDSISYNQFQKTSGAMDKNACSTIYCEHATMMGVVIGKVEIWVNAIKN